MTAGRMVYCVSYPVPKYRREDTPRQRGEKRRASSQWRAKLNRLKSCRRLEQLIFTNFGAGDLYLTLTYRDECLPGSRREVMGDVKYFRRKLAQRRQARGESCRYLYTVEHKTSGGRWHAHMILSGAGLDDLEDIRQSWTKGFCHIDWYDPKQGEELASYLAKERPDRTGEHPWMASRGLRRPQEDSLLVPDSARLSIPAGAVVKDRSRVSNSYGEFEYIQYYLP